MERRSKLKAFIDSFVMFFLIFIFVGLRLRWWALPSFRGYFENDISIRYPFMRESVPLGVLGGVSAAVIFVTVLATEVIRHKKGLYSNNVGASGNQVWLWEVSSYMRVYLYGLFSSLIIIYMGKFGLGTLRPHFIDVCRPIPLSGSSWSESQNALGYIRAYTCNGFGWFWVEGARMSFPSAHASFAMYNALFFILYLEKKARWHVAKAMRHLVQFGALLAAWYVGSTRLAENWSHWSDVAAGYLIGGVFAATFFYFNFMPRTQKKQEKNSEVNIQQPYNVAVVNQQQNGLPVPQPLDQPPQYNP